MNARSDFTSTHPDGSRFSSSLPHQIWTQVPSSRTAGPSATTISPQVRFRHGESTLDESILARRTTAFRQLNGHPRPLSRRPRETKPVSGRPSTLGSQPVLVRSYSDEDNDIQPSSAMSAEMMTPRRMPELPAVQDFSIEGILRAIEPDIRSTLDSIAEICGRSKLSLANEYGSHIAPFGEVQAPLGSLLTVEEASASSERLADGNVVIVDDDNSLLEGRDSYTSFGLLENLRQTAYATGYQHSRQSSHDDGASTQAQPDTPGPTTVANITPHADSDSHFSPMAKEFPTKARPDSRSLLKSASRSAAEKSSANIVTPAMLSEIHLDARANGSSWPSVPPDIPQASPIPAAAEFPAKNGVSILPSRFDKLSLMADVQGWLGWLKAIVQREEKAYTPPHSAESTLRTLLERHHSTNLPHAQGQAVAVMSG